MSQHSGATAAADYPVRYLQRLPIPWQVVRTIINKMRSEDIYAHISHFPSSEHRSAALARQASQLYLLLYYDPELLQVCSSPVVTTMCTSSLLGQTATLYGGCAVSPVTLS